MLDPIKLSQSNIIIADNQFNIIPPCTQPTPTHFLNSNEYSRYLLCCLTVLSRNNLTLYRLPKNLKIYRGDPTYTTQPTHPKGKMSFYFNAEDASQNGFIQEFKLKQSIDVIALDRVSNIEILSADAINENKYDIANAITNNYSLKRFDERKTAIFTKEDPIMDLKILDYLSLWGYSGFAHKPLNNRPARILLHSTQQYLSPGQFSKYNNQFVAHVSQFK